MSDELRERLSAWMDDELQPSDTPELMAAMGRNPEVLDLWSRYHLIGTTLRHGLPDCFDPGLAERVRNAIGDELPEADDLPAGPSRGRPGWVKPVAGMAIAASVAAVAVVGVQMMNTVAPPPVQTASTVAGESPATGAKAVPAAVAGGDPPLQQSAADLDRERLTRYLLHHNEIVNSRGVRGVLPYVRVVTQDGTAPRSASGD